MPFRWTVTLRTFDGIPANYIQNQFCTSGGGGDDGDIADALKAFYNGINSSVFPNTIAQNGHSIKRYDLPGLTPNYPTYEEEFNLTAGPTGDSLPPEVAICLSFQGVRTPGQFQARRRGRIFLGPVRTAAMVSGRPSSTVRSAIVGAAQTLATSVRAITDAGDWAVWSVVDGVAVDLVDCWVDDAWDTQRSRGVPATTRTVGAL